VLHSKLWSINTELFSILYFISFVVKYHTIKEMHSRDIVKNISTENPYVTS